MLARKFAPFWTFSHFEAATTQKPLEKPKVAVIMSDEFLMIQVIFPIKNLKVHHFWQYNSFIINSKKNVLAEAHKKDWAGQHPELLCWTSNRQFENKMDLPLEKVSKITCSAPTIIFTTIVIFSVNFPCGRKPEYPEKTHDFRQSVDWLFSHEFTHESIARIEPTISEVKGACDCAI
jgi:hypothetical protein